MKKILSLILPMFMSFILVACGQGESQVSDGSAETFTQIDSANNGEVSEVTETKPNWVECKFTIDGIEYQLPFDMSQLIESGWTTCSMYDEDYSGILVEPKSKTKSIQSNNKNYEMGSFGSWVTIANTSDEQITADKGTVIGVRLDLDGYVTGPGEQPEFVLGGKVTWGSTREDVIGLLGEPTKVYDSTSDIEYNYNDYDYYMEFSFDDENGGLEGVDISTRIHDLPVAEFKYVEE